MKTTLLHDTLLVSATEDYTYKISKSYMLRFFIEL